MYSTVHQACKQVYPLALLSGCFNWALLVFHLNLVPIKHLQTVRIEQLAQYYNQSDESRQYYNHTVNSGA